MNSIFSALVREWSRMILKSPDLSVLNVYSPRSHEIPPFFQSLKLEEGDILIECASFVRLDESVGRPNPDILTSLGWNRPNPEDNYPNFFQIVQHEFIESEKMIELMTDTFVKGFALNEQSRFQFHPYEYFLESTPNQYPDNHATVFALGDFHG